MINRNKVVFIYKTDLKTKGKIVFGRCPAHGVLCAFIEIDNFENRYERIPPTDFIENICL